MCKINTQTTFLLFSLASADGNEFRAVVVVAAVVRQDSVRAWVGVRIVKEQERGMRLSFGTGYCPR